MSRQEDMLKACLGVMDFSLNGLKQVLLDSLPWVEDVRLDDSAPGFLAVEVIHSYPQGIDIRPWIKPLVMSRLAVHVRAEITYTRVSPQEGDEIRKARERHEHELERRRQRAAYGLRCEDVS